MAFMDGLIEGVTCAGLFAALCTNLFLRDTVPKRQKKKKKKKQRLEWKPGEDSRDSTRHRLSIVPVVDEPSGPSSSIAAFNEAPLTFPKTSWSDNVIHKQPLRRSPRQASNLTADTPTTAQKERKGSRMEDGPQTRASSRLRDDSFPKISRSDTKIYIQESLTNRPTLFVQSNDGIYLVPQNHGSQIYSAKHLGQLHSVQKLHFTLKGLPSPPPPPEVRYYSPFQDHHDDFLVVINKPDTVAGLIQGFPFDTLCEYTASSC
jgi:hypothetical protein